MVNSRRIIMVVYHDGRPHSVVTESEERGHDGRLYLCVDQWDFDWCQRDRTLYRHLSGCGGGKEFALYGCTSPYQVWAAADVTLIQNAVPPGYFAATRLKSPLKAWPLSKLFDMSEEEESGCVYCSECRDHLPGDDSYHLCEHVRWCDRAGWWSTPDERCPAGCLDCLADGYPTAADTLARLGEGYGWAAEPDAEGNPIDDDRDYRWYCRRDSEPGGYAGAAEAFFEERA